MESAVREQLVEILKLYPSIKLAYFFGSQVTGNIGPLSDYDFALYLYGNKDKKEMFDIKLELQEKISRLLKTDRVDIVLLNTAENPELQYQVITQGTLLYEVEPHKILVEPKILNIYFDFRAMLIKNDLTKS